MTISVEKYEGDYTDLVGLTLDGFELASIADQLNRWDVYVGYEDGTARGYFVLSSVEDTDTFVTLSPLRSLPYVAYLFNSGTPQLRTSMAAKVREIIVGREQRHFLACNLTGSNDEAWAQIFQDGGAVVRLGSVMMFDAGSGL